MKSKWSILSINFPQKYFDTYPQNNSIYVAQYTICLWEEKKKINQLLPVQQQQPGICRMLGSAQAVLELQEAVELLASTCGSLAVADN